MNIKSDRLYVGSGSSQDLLLYKEISKWKPKQISRDVANE